MLNFPCLREGVLGQEEKKPKLFKMYSEIWTVANSIFSSDLLILFSYGLIAFKLLMDFIWFQD